MSRKRMGGGGVGELILFGDGAGVMGVQPAGNGGYSDYLTLRLGEWGFLTQAEDPGVTQRGEQRPREAA